MGALIGAARALGRLNGALLSLGLWLGTAALVLMVAAILAQVWFRYVLGNALAWSEEAARFFMLWSTGLMAATAYRRGGFVGIDMLQMLMPRAVAAVLQLLLLGVAFLVLAVAFRIGWSEMAGLGARFALPSLSVPTSFALDSWMKVPRGWMMMSLHVGVTLLLLVNVELILRSIAQLFGRADALEPIPEAVMAGAE